MFWVNLLIDIVLKCLMAFISYNLKSLAFILFLVDNQFSLKIILGFYFYLNNYLQNMYIYDGHYVILFCYLNFFSIFGYIFSTLYYDKRKGYNYMLGFLCMEVFTLGVLIAFKSHYDILTMGLSKYEFVFLIQSMINFYICFNTFLMLKVRGSNYYESDYIFGYYAMWTDWFSYFWRDIFKLMDSPKIKKSINETETDNSDEEYDS